MSNFTATLRDWNDSYISGNPIFIDTEVFRAEDQFSLRYGSISVITTRERLNELRDKITAALDATAPVVDDIELCPKCGFDLDGCKCPAPVADPMDEPAGYNVEADNSIERQEEGGR